MGPKNCGKSRLKAELISRDATNQRIIHVNCGLQGDLTHIQNSLLALLETLPTCGTVSRKKYPIIILDEVNRLKEWQEEYPAALTSFVDFLQRISKEAEKAHVVLLTSESSMVSWLERGTGDKVFEVMVLGDLSQEEAKRFVRGGKMEDGNGEEEFWPGRISQYPKLQMNDGEWKKVFKVCGGNMWDLSCCVGTAGSTGSWEKGERREVNKQTKLNIGYCFF